MSKIESDVCVDESVAYFDALRKSGHLIAAQALQPVQTATAGRVRAASKEVKS